MGFPAKISNMQICKKKGFRILLLVELVLLFIGVLGLFGKDNVQEYGLDDMTVNFGMYADNYMGIYADASSGGAGCMVEFGGISLPRGSYMVQLHYATDIDMKNTVQVVAHDIGAESVRINPTTFFAGLESTNEEMWLLRDTKQLNVRANYGGEGSLAIQSLTIRETNAMNRIYLFVMLCLFTLVNGIWVYVEYDRKYGVSVESKTVAFLLGVIILFASIPVMFDYVWGGADLSYHLMRVEGIKDGILAGQFPIRISPEWQQGYGYASPIFYGETILYLAALFRLIGFSVLTSCRLFLFVITVATVLIAYYCFKKIFINPYVSVLCSAVYTLSVYRNYTSFMRTAWGEGLGVMLLPILVYGFYRVFTQDVREESYKRSWLPLTVGFSLLVQSHLLTGELAGLFTIILCVVLWKMVLRLPTFIVLAKAAVYSVLLSAWFLVPFLDYMLTGDFTIHHVSGRTIQSRGGYLAHLLFTFFEPGSTIYFDRDGMVDSSPVGVGIVLIVSLLVFGYLLITGKANKLLKEERALGLIAASFGVLAMIMSLSAFPWDKIHSLNQITATLVSSLQFPSRLLTIANVCLTAVVGVLAKYVISTKTKEHAAWFFAGMILCLAVSNLYLIERTTDRQGALRVYNERGMGTGYISGAEYLPYGADATLFMPHDPIVSGELYVSDYEKKSLGAECYLANRGEVCETAVFALLHYKGYHAYHVEGGEELYCYGGENFQVAVDIPAGFEGTVEVRFESPWYWRAGEIVTLLSFGFVVICLVRYKGEERGKVCG